jgi:hypothetical protein
MVQKGNGMLNLEEIFERYEDEFLRFDRVEEKLHSRRDLCAFLLLDKLMPGTKVMVSAAGHDEIWLDIDCDELAAVAEEKDILTLIRCGVRNDEGYLAMFV